MKGDKSDPANYRPISATCILCKVIEHIIASNISKHLTQFDILYELQHSFHEKRSFETQLIQLVKDLSRQLTLDNQTDLVLLDFSKAFDKVNPRGPPAFRLTELSSVIAYLANQGKPFCCLVHSIQPTKMYIFCSSDVRNELQFGIIAHCNYSLCLKIDIILPCLFCLLIYSPDNIPSNEDYVHILFVIK